MGAEVIFIGAGAGMGVDSGLPDFRGPEGFWKEYPVFRERGFRFEDIANPRWFAKNPEKAWGFYGHRLNLYRKTTPHAGFGILREWAGRASFGAFVFTSNVDGQFQKAGFDPDRIVECHGSIHHLQCSEGCPGIWDASDVHLEVDPMTISAQGQLPLCPRCDAIARPNILMFEDMNWQPNRTRSQQSKLDKWLAGQDGLRSVVIECGAGDAIPTVRLKCEHFDGRLIRINPREFHVPDGHIGLPMSAADALSRINTAMG
ncbi:MAG: NAD-dependent SIR2 family protein deacetylase [Limisphaerales bacterium]|jgi:NAD-dependent SIR2 family protein deacetylase